MLQQCGPPASFSNIQTAINKDQAVNPTEGESGSGLGRPAMQNPASAMIPPAAGELVEVEPRMDVGCTFCVNNIVTADLIIP